MAFELLIINDTGAKKPFEPPAGEDWAHWQTCIRKIHIGRMEWLSNLTQEILTDPRVEVFKGEKAYQFCLETLCGLNSPMVGETEVFGQFKQLVEQHVFPCSPWGHKLQKLFKQMIGDVKNIRKEFLTGLGSHSYGSVSRRHFKNFEEVNIVGAGLLTKDILPWLLKQSLKIRVHCRRPEVAREFLAEFKARLSIERLHDPDSPALIGGVVVSAPLTSQELGKWITRGDNRISSVLDFRGDSSSDRLEFSGVVSLDEVFEQMQRSKSHLHLQVLKAKELIEQISAKKTHSVSHRPFGWDDLCHY